MSTAHLTIDDPEIPFRVSHATAIVTTKARLDNMVTFLYFVGSSTIILLGAILGALLLR